MIRYTEELRHYSDLLDLYDLLSWREHLGPGGEEKLQHALKGSYAVCHAYADEILVGTARLVSDGALHAYLCGVGVRNSHRGHGIGAELTRRLVEKAAEGGMHVQLLCEASLVSYYEDLGFASFAVGMRR